jgi:hypothetical protein
MQAQQPQPQPEQLSTTAKELRLVSRQTALATLKRLHDGYRDKSGSSYGAAKGNSIGCVLAQKTPNRAASPRLLLCQRVLTLCFALGQRLRPDRPRCCRVGQDASSQGRSQEGKAEASECSSSGRCRIKEVHCQSVCVCVCVFVCAVTRATQPGRHRQDD